MTKLPATYAEALEAAALQLVRDEIAWFATNKLPIMGIDVAVFDDESARHFARGILKRYASSHPLCMMSIVDDAKAGWDLADEALRELILEFLDRGEPLPTYLGAFAMDIVARAPRHTSGPKKADKFFRDLLVAVFVAKAVRFGLRPTRSGARAASACSVVAHAMTMSEASVVAIWKKFGRPNFSRDINLLPWEKLPPELFQ